MMMVLVSIAIAAMAAQTSQPSEQTMLVSRDGLQGWTADATKSGCVRNETVNACAGWVRTDATVFGDYTMAFEIRARGADARVLLGVLGINDRPGGRPNAVIAIPLLGAADARMSPRVRVQLLPVNAAGRAEAMKQEGEWQSYAVTRNRLGVHVLLNGVQILSSGPVHASDGWIGFLADGDGIDLRDVRLRHLFPSASPGVGTREPMAAAADNAADGLLRPGKDVTLPKVKREVRPSYTGAALAAKIEGNVVVECVVATDGTVTKATVIRSLDDRFGLDEEALKAARQWRFEPATRNGAPVPVVITIQLSFTLKK